MPISSSVYTMIHLPAIRPWVQPTFHYGDADSIKLATFVQKNLVAELGTKDRSSRFASFYVIRYTKMTAILVEVAFISNPEEEVLLIKYRWSNQDS